MIFSDHPEFTPNLSPQEMFKLGIFGGSYYRDIHSSVTSQDYTEQWKEFEWAINIPKELLSRPTPSAKLNKYKVLAGSSLLDWEQKEWIVDQDPYGWVQWYCRFYAGRRSPDDKRQIKRWLNFTGPNGRFKKQLINKLKAAKTTYDDPTISPVVRQGLLQWAYSLVPEDLE
jgi:hypothetical protein